MNTRRLVGAVSALIATVAALTLPFPAGAKAACAVAPAAAHRGNWDGKYPDNSRNGFRYAQNKGATWWETDVDVVDGEFIIRHDPTAPVLMTLAEFLNDMAVDNVQVFMELKWSPTEVQWTQLMNMIWQAGIRKNLVITSFNGPDLLVAEQRDPTIRRGLIASTGAASAASITQYHVQYYIKHSDSITAARMAEWRGAGLQIVPWSDHLNNAPSEWQRMNYYPMAAIVTDTGSAYNAWAAQQGCTVTKR